MTKNTDKTISRNDVLVQSASIMSIKF